MIIKLVVFDFNGVIVPDTQACKEADDEVIKAYGGKPPSSVLHFRETFTIPAVDYYLRHGCDRRQLEANPELMGKVFHKFYEPRAGKLRTRKGVRTVLAYLQAISIPAVISSNHTQQGVEAQLSRLKIAHFFTNVLANKSGQTSMVERNKLEKLADYLEAGHYRPENCLIIGDSPEEIEIGRQLGLKTVAISGGYYAAWRLKAAAGGQGPHFPIISTMIGLIRIFESVK